MTLLDAPSYDQSQTKKRRNLLIATLISCGLVGIVVFLSGICLRSVA